MWLDVLTLYWQKLNSAQKNINTIESAWCNQILIYLQQRTWSNKGRAASFMPSCATIFKWRPSVDNPAA